MQFWFNAMDRFYGTVNRAFMPPGHQQHFVQVVLNPLRRYARELATMLTEVRDRVKEPICPALAGAEPAVPDHVSPAKLPNRPPDIAFRAWWIRESGLASKQREIAEKITQQGTPATQGQVSKWLKAVEDFQKAGGVVPTVDELKARPQAVDPAILDMGARQDRRTPRQRPRRDPDADADDE